jgi:hypothetical protein
MPLTVLASSDYLFVKRGPVPFAPTIGTATASGGNAIVAFTPQSGGPPATSFTAISSPYGFTGTATASPITVPIKFFGTNSYTFTVVASNSYSNSVASGNSNPVSITVTSILISKGDSLAGWSFNGTPAVVDNAVGNPTPSFYADSYHCSYIDVASIIPGLTSFKNRKIVFDIYTSLYLVNFYFGMNSSGAGNGWRLDTRNQQTSGYATVLNWQGINQPTTGVVGLSGSTWYTVVLTIANNGTVTYTYNGTSSGTNQGYLDNGTYIGFQGDSLNGGWIDNIYIQ